jgi:hypothetical protein
MDDGRFWGAAVAAQTVVTVICAALTAGYFLRAYRRSVSPGRRTAALALVLMAVSAAVQAVAWLVRGGTPAAFTAGLPACAGQVLTALLVLRQLERG